MRFPWYVGPTWEGTWGGTGLLVVATVFLANMAYAKVSHLPQGCHVVARASCQPLQDPGVVQL